ncbi:Epidermal Growth Factor Receptor Kinase Substrate 8-Like Protein 1 [Manis pentadactyla]|nr:Epidermal Growth Factor Receptor Kinase Substrate 8-Like Protein 1 [Manis pentadactyla]
MEVLEDKRHGHYLPTHVSGTVGGEGPTGEEGWVLNLDCSPGQTGIHCRKAGYEVNPIFSFTFIGRYGYGLTGKESPGPIPGLWKFLPYGAFLSAKLLTVLSNPDFVNKDNEALEDYESKLCHFFEAFPDPPTPPLLHALTGPCAAPVTSSLPPSTGFCVHVPDHTTDSKVTEFTLC